MKAYTAAGLDEVGRGALFGPVFAGAVILDNQAEDQLIDAGLKDSKKLSALKRSNLVPLIKKISHCWAIGQSSAREIDLLGIRNATEKAMIRAVHRLEKQPDVLLIDGCLNLRLWHGEQKTVIKGEDLYPSIAAASVLAKVARDDLIKRMAEKYPQYGLEKHVGYGTALHRAAISKFGKTKLHRKTFLSKIQ
ncbi:MULTISPECIES: ribonuclease HII [Prochlorococcus]|uniref:Ribonuclease HII n=1 Tax=Prochlorococcus marinus (strain SARG / CCMP1375 / SS120) TaxID=167539 RepID=RNH2_PROMA|nr:MULTISPECIES: ribonuclease HII [Prochlorococcus]Q7VA11.1 RecName: Full=Ribonuclease HII; Short=RNase HII [Prochlorococcus marinus subsp. marinus str. CCMP1375]AAQ00702.1 Ribonuclease HII [Prochlorococcus marinus subsp. marinus str. CCMP1375]KGG10802.1 Ribonuclease HII [Prochlorococcus marinus str. LG]KGG20150.1 Ribonuclease HII [Prochlorococcus marinus str. SS2]KGG24050.1 Ribonuclease HII [Prochlorococcus marinus str. SS35]KGG31691.1 Ribonuclease HII [Prochlorococcus marinus str. SS51]